MGWWKYFLEGGCIVVKVRLYFLRIHFVGRVVQRWILIFGGCNME